MESSKKFATYQIVATKKGEGSLQLDLPDLEEDSLPTVSVVTVANNLSYIGSMLYIWINYIYPPKKLEWVVVEGDADIECYLPQNDDRIHYYRGGGVSSHDRLNFAVQNAKHDYIVHMDESVFYFSDSILAKIRVIMHNSRAGLLTWQTVSCGSKTLMKNDRTTSYLDSSRLATLAYNKKYWLHRQFSEKPDHFIAKKYGDWMNLPFIFNGISLVDSDGEIELSDISSMFPEKYRFILENMKSL